jgi:hypothetical protein
MTSYFVHLLEIVIRFNRDELLKLRRPTKVLPAMIELLDVVSIPPLEPVCSEPFEAEDVR